MSISDERREASFQEMRADLDRLIEARADDLFRKKIALWMHDRPRRLFERRPGENLFTPAREWIRQGKFALETSWNPAFGLWLRIDRYDWVQARAIFRVEVGVLCWRLSLTRYLRDGLRPYWVKP